MSESRQQLDVIGSTRDTYDALRFVSEETECPYLPDRHARTEAYLVDLLDPAAYERLLRRGFRRSGHVVYRPRCRGCQECRQIRVPVETFKPTRSMSRVMRMNKDVEVDVSPPAATDEKYALFRDYLDFQHDGTMSRSYESFEEFLYDSPTDTLEFTYRLGRRIIGVSLADRLPQGLSSIYMYFDPGFANRSLGTFSALWEIEHCRREGLPYYYLGYFVAGSRTMSYKARFRPNQILVGDDRWVSLME